MPLAWRSVLSLLHQRQALLLRAQPVLLWLVQAQLPLQRVFQRQGQERVLPSRRHLSSGLVSLLQPVPVLLQVPLW